MAAKEGLLALLLIALLSGGSIAQQSAKPPDCRKIVDPRTGKLIELCDPNKRNGTTATLPGHSSHRSYARHRASNGSADGSELTPVRALILPAEQPPKDVAAYGVVAFTARPAAAEKDRSRAVCEAYKSTLITQDEAKDVPIQQQMITFWPVTARPEEQLDDPSCDFMIERYDLKAALDAVRDADTEAAQLAKRRGPFLIAWSPSAARAKRDSVILVIDMSTLESADSFNETFRDWRQKIIDDPKFWRNGFSMERVRLALRDLLDHYGETLMPFLPKPP